MARIHGCHVMSREAMLFMKYEHYGKCKGSFKDSQRKCKYSVMKPVGGANISQSAKRFLKKFSDDRWFHHSMKVKK